MRRQVHQVGFAAIAAAGLASGGVACGGHEEPAPRAAAKLADTCIPAGADVALTRMALTGATFTFCLGTLANQSCFVADLEAKTISAAAIPTDASDDRPLRKNLIFESGPTSASIKPSANGKALTVCTADKATCHDIPIAAARIDDAPTAVSDDARYVAIDTRSFQNDARKSPGRLETWDAVTATKVASFEMPYGPDNLGMPDVPRRGTLGFLGHTVIGFTVPGCALPCSSATMYSVRGKSLGMLASDPTAARAEHFHHDLYVVHSYGPPGPFVVQDAATGKTVQLDADTNWEAAVTPDHIVRVVGLSWNRDPAPRSPRVQVWGPDLKLVSDIALPVCAAVPARSALLL